MNYAELLHLAIVLSVFSIMSSRFETKLHFKIYSIFNITPGSFVPRKSSLTAKSKAKKKKVLSYKEFQHFNLKISNLFFLTCKCVCVCVCVCVLVGEGCCSKCFNSKILNKEHFSYLGKIKALMLVCPVKCILSPGQEWKDKRSITGKGTNFSELCLFLLFSFTKGIKRASHKQYLFILLTLSYSFPPPPPPPSSIFKCKVSCMLL